MWQLAMCQVRSDESTSRGKEEEEEDAPVGAKEDEEQQRLHRLLRITCVSWSCGKLNLKLGL